MVHYIGGYTKDSFIATIPFATTQPLTLNGQRRLSLCHFWILHCDFTSWSNHIRWWWWPIEEQIHSQESLSPFKLTFWSHWLPQFISSRHQPSYSPTCFIHQWGHHQHKQALTYGAIALQKGKLLNTGPLSSHLHQHVFRKKTNTLDKLLTEMQRIPYMRGPPTIMIMCIHLCQMFINTSALNLGD